MNVGFILPDLAEVLNSTICFVEDLTGLSINLLPSLTFWELFSLLFQQDCPMYPKKEVVDKALTFRVSEIPISLYPHPPEDTQTGVV